MKTRTTHTGLRTTPWLSLCVALTLASAASAQTQRYYPPAQGGYPQQPQYSQQPPAGYGGYGYQQQPQTRYESPIEFLPKFGKRMGEMFRRVFYGQEPSGWSSPPPAYGSNGGYSLDSTPRQYQAPNYPQQQQPSGYYQPQQPSGYYQPQQPGYQYPPQQGQTQQRSSIPQQPAYQTPPRTQQPLPPQPKSTAPAPTTQSKSTTRTYTPPKVGDSSSRPKTQTQSKPSPTVKPKPPVQEAPPPPTTTTRRSEITPKEPSSTTTASSSSSGSFLKGRKASKPGRVISPYPPYKELDVTGLESGSLALDPTTQKVFEVP